MRRQGTLVALVAAVAVAAAITCSPASAAAATSSVAFTKCADAPTFGCGHLIVPLDPTNVIPGTVALAIRRQLAATGTATQAVVALAGGPGQAALPFASDAAGAMSAGLATRDLIVFDQRGTGDSGALKCAALRSSTESLRTVIPDCARQIGATRGLYTTDNTVADIEAMRKALGYARLVLFGTSSGTKVALRYAAQYPGNVAGLILDSPVVANGPDIFDQSTYAAVPRILSEICAAGACPGIPDPLAELRKVLGRLNRGPVRATYVNGHGVAAPLKIAADDLAAILVAGDEDPALRADFPAAVAAAAGADYAPLAILVAHFLLGSAANTTVDNPLFFDTTCEELPFPWPRSDRAAQRIAAALAAAKALPSGTFGPFSYLTAYRQSAAASCAYWPFLSPAPERTITALPNVPTLIISGADDLRTPTENARAVAALIPDATVVVVPQTGHSVLSSEPSTCAADAVNGFFAGTTIKTACARVKVFPYLQPAPAAPASLRSLPPLPGTHGVTGRTERAVELTLGWSARELAESLFETLIGSYNPAFTHGLGGLHGGYAKQTTSKQTTSKRPRKLTLTFHHFSYVPGVTVTGSITDGIGRLTIGGPRAAAGRLVATKFNQFSGRLGGILVHLRISHAQAVALTASVAR